MKKRRLLFLNPPGRKVYLRDYFCSKTSQADYINHPIDFVFLSGILKCEFELDALDAIVEGLEPAACLTEILSRAPDVVVGLCGSVSWKEDREFYRALVEQVRTRLILTGDLLIDDRQERLENLPFVDAFVHDFSTNDVLKYLRGEFGSLRNLTIRRGGGVQALPLERHRSRVLRLPMPEHRIFLDKPYRYPFVRSRRFATVMTDYGCPYRCSFCVMSTLGWKYRPVDDVLEELEQLLRLGIREVFFLDQTFGLPKERALHLLEEMRRFDRLGWVCFTRPDLARDRQFVRSLRLAGCHTVIMGLESGRQEILDSVLKDYTTDQVQAGFENCREHGLRTVATVLLGLPLETTESFEGTLEFLRRVEPDFASFNVAVPRMGTPFRRDVIGLGLTDAASDIMDQSGNPVAIPTLSLTREQVEGLKRRAIRQFYLSPRSIGRRLARQLGGGVSSFSDLLVQARQGAGLVSTYFGG